MADLTQPATAAEFMSAGADAATAEHLAMQHNTMTGRAGTPEQRAELTIGMRNQPPSPKPQAKPATTPAEATAALEAHTNEQLSAHLDSVFAGPLSASDYRFPHVAGNVSDEQLAADTAIKGELQAAAVPKMVVDSIAQSLAEQDRKLSTETPQQQQARIASNRSSLERLWGKDFNTNLAAVDTYLDGLRESSPGLRGFIDSAAHVLTPLDLDLILQVAKHRAGKH